MKQTHSFLVLAAGIFGAVPLAHAQSHPVFSLVDNRPLAHWQRRGGLYLEAGQSGMARYVHFSRPLATWRLRAIEEGRKVALATTAATLEVPLTAAQAKASVVYLGLKSPTQSTLRINVLDKSNKVAQSSAAVNLKPGWQVVTVKLPDGALAQGENRLGLIFAKPGLPGQMGGAAGMKAGAAVEFIQVGGSAPAQADPLVKGPELPLYPDGGVAYFAFIPTSGALSATGDGGGCKVSVQVNGAALGELKLDGSSFELSSQAGKFVRLELLASGPCGAVKLTRADLITAGAAPSLAARNPPKNVILWISDSTRADKWKAINPKTRVESPFFTELAKRSTLFRNAYVQGNESRASHASLFTAMYPGVHGMINEKVKLRPEYTILPESVKPSGRFTLGVMGNGYIDKFWGFGDGWDFLHNHIHEGGGLKAEDLLAEGKSLMGKYDGKPQGYFLYVGSIDAHVSWRAHEPWISRYDTEPYKGPFIKAALDPDIEKVALGTLKINERDHTRIKALYDSDISYTDANLKALFDELKKRGHENDTMFIFSADHGEEMWDHGRLGHGQSLHEELVHVPLLIYYPPYFPAGKVVDEGADASVDIMPTIDDALGVKIPDAAQGESLLPLAEGIGAGYPRPSIASQYELAHTMRLGNYKIWVGGSGDVHLIDASVDPNGDKDLFANHPVERRALTDAMGLWMANRATWKKRKWGVASNLSAGFAADLDK